jgi:sugar O-acyltransferase (sialic acid O-acetyltransferase NeuD family)
MPLLVHLRAAAGDLAMPVFVVDHPEQNSINGYPVLAYQDWLAQLKGPGHASIAISDGTIREHIAQRLMGDGIEPLTVRASNSVVMHNVEVAEGATLCPFVTLTSNIRIGRHFHANLYSYVAHDCIIGDFVTFAPAVKCNGNVIVEDHAYVGTGAIIRQGTPNKPIVIGRGAVVGMGAVVTRSVAPGATVVGSPARPISK